MKTNNKRLKRFRRLFNKKSKPIIGMIHLKPLPGSPNHSLSIPEIIAAAVDDFNALVMGGIDGVLIENYHDNPYHATECDTYTNSIITLIVKALQKRTNIPIGINILRNACSDALKIAQITNADFIRCNIFTGAYVTDQGIIQGCARKLQTIKKNWSLRLENNYTNTLIFADVFCKHATPIASRNINYEIADAFNRGLADAIIITGNKTGEPIDLETLQNLYQENKSSPIILGSGLTSDNAEQLLEYADGAIVGTFTKKDHLIEKPVDTKNVQKLMKIIEEKWR
ncbi:MAG: BtpA/SgcQ family protein [Asgard group archaeon]|nr:BtpA/SgcQ family protein [Asgard group archaeon]